MGSVKKAEQGEEERGGGGGRDPAGKGRQETPVRSVPRGQKGSGVTPQRREPPAGPSRPVPGTSRLGLGIMRLNGSLRPSAWMFFLGLCRLIPSLLLVEQLNPASAGRSV